MPGKQINPQTIDNLADAATGVSAGGATFTWLSQAGGVVDLIAGCIAIVAGVFAIAHYVRTWRITSREEKRKQNDS